jgi:CDP-diacylglycerol--glycerol-3-phosphate 3-phosphatidyltransferase
MSDNLAPAASGTVSPTVRALPNILTMGRLVLTFPFFAALYWAEVWLKRDVTWPLDVAFGLFILAGVTDILDGLIARRFRAQTLFGRTMDPAIDKILVCGSFVFLIVPPFNVPAWVVATVIVREIGVTALRGAAEAQGHPFPGTWSGKLKMFVESFTVGYTLFYVAHWLRYDSVQDIYVPRYVLAHHVYVALLALTVVTVTLSGLLSVHKWWRLTHPQVPPRDVNGTSGN